MIHTTNILSDLRHHKQNIISYKAIFLINLIQYYKFLSIAFNLIIKNSNFYTFILNYIYKILNYYK